MQRLIAHAPNLTHRTMLLTTYAAGLRLNEVLHLRVGDIDSARMTIRVEQGKGGQDRYTVLSARLLDALRAAAPARRRAADPVGARQGLPTGRQADPAKVAALVRQRSYSLRMRPLR